MKFSAYPKYKASGVEWLGDVPEHWEVKRLKTSATCWISNVDKVPAEDELPVRLCNYTDVYYHDHITPDMGLMETTATADEIRRFGLQVGDVVMTKDSESWDDIAVPALVMETAPDLVCGYHLAIVRSRKNVLSGGYLLRAFQACAINQQFQVAASGVTRYGLPKASIGDAWISLPPLLEQQAIAEFLDRETGRMDRLMAKKRELIERLKEKRTALISRTVTHGLPPAAARAAGFPENPPLKPSGLDWLGDIPAHWACGNLRRFAKMRTGHTPSRNEPDYWADCTIPWFTLADVWQLRDGKKKYLGETKEMISELGLANSAAELLPPGTVIFSRTASIGFSGIMPTPMATTQDFWNWICGPKLNPEYLLMLFRAMGQVFDRLTSGSTHKTIYQPDAASLSIPVPPLPEQTAIATYLDAEAAKLDALVAKVETAIERLQEYRTALITAAVTGKIDVRNFVASADANQVCSELC